MEIKSQIKKLQSQLKGNGAQSKAHPSKPIESLSMQSHDSVVHDEMLAERIERLGKKRKEKVFFFQWFAQLFFFLVAFSED